MRAAREGAHQKGIFELLQSQTTAGSEAAISRYAATQ
jgi:hypothetical protein